MKRDLTALITGCYFIVAAVLLWLGWMLMPTHIDSFFKTSDFAEIHSNWHWWIWCYRFHLFGHAISAIALVALGGSRELEAEARVVIWPGIAVAFAGIFITALGHAFYYHHGAWGALEMQGKSELQILAFVESLRVDTEYNTCLVRFGRVFTGLGLLLLGVGLFKWKLLPAPVSGVAVLIGLAAMALTMGLPDKLSLYMPIFHVWVLWLLGTGIVVIRSGKPRQLHP